MPVGTCSLADYGDGAEDPNVLRLIPAKDGAAGFSTPPFSDTPTECFDMPNFVVESMLGKNCSALDCDGSYYGTAGSLAANLTRHLLRGFCPVR